MKHHRIGLIALAGLAIALPGRAETHAAPDAPRGEMLYATHCIACHTTQVHWRENRLARDWDSLAAQVRRWQANEGLHWNDGDVRAVTRYLNGRYYHFPEDEETASSGAAKKP